MPESTSIATLCCEVFGVRKKTSSSSFRAYERQAEIEASVLPMPVGAFMKMLFLCEMAL